MNETATTQPQPATTDRSMWALIQAAHAVEEKLEAALATAGLSMPKFSVLSELVSAGKPLTLSELASKLSCVRSNMTQLVDRLETDGLVTRVDDPADRRSVRASITELGRERQAAGSEQVARVQAEFSKLLGENERATVSRLVTALK